MVHKIIHDKKAQTSERWLEYISGILLVVGFIVAARATYLGIAYVVILITGTILGRIWYTHVKEKTNKLYLAIMTLALLVGMLLGSFGTSRILVIVLFISGILISYGVHEEKLLKLT